MPKSLLSKIDKVLPFVSELPIFADLPQQELRDIAQASEFLLLPGGKRIFAECEPAHGGFITIKGTIMLTKHTHKGKHVAVELVGPGDPFGIVSAAQNRPYPLSADTIKESLVYQINQNFLVELTQRHPHIKSRLLEICADRVRHTHAMISRLADADSRIRVAGALLLYADKFAERLGELERIEVSRQELSTLAATTVETCIRVTRALENSGVLAFPKLKCIDILNRSFLEEICQ